MITGFFSTLFSKIGFLIILYFIIGIFLGPVGSHAGHLPSSTVNSGSDIGAWVIWVIQVILWPVGLAFHHPTIRL